MFLFRILTPPLALQGGPAPSVIAAGSTPVPPPVSDDSAPRSPSKVPVRIPFSRGFTTGLLQSASDLVAPRADAPPENVMRLAHHLPVTERQPGGMRFSDPHNIQQHAPGIASASASAVSVGAALATNHGMQQPHHPISIPRSMPGVPSGLYPVLDYRPILATGTHVRQNGEAPYGYPMPGGPRTMYSEPLRPATAGVATAFPVLPAPLRGCRGPNSAGKNSKGKKKAANSKAAKGNSKQRKKPSKGPVAKKEKNTAASTVAESGESRKRPAPPDLNSGASVNGAASLHKSELDTEQRASNSDSDKEDSMAVDPPEDTARPMEECGNYDKSSPPDKVKKPKEPEVDRYAGHGMVTKLKEVSNNTLGAEDIKVAAVILGFCPIEMRPRFESFIVGLEVDGIVAFVQHVCELLKNKQAPARAVFKGFGGMKTHAHPDNKQLSFRDKLKGKIAFQVLENSSWESVKTKDPPWNECVKCEFRMILQEFNKTNPGCRIKAGFLKQLENFLTTEFYEALLTKFAIPNVEAAGPAPEVLRTPEPPSLEHRSVVTPMPPMTMSSDLPDPRHGTLEAPRNSPNGTTAFRPDLNPAINDSSRRYTGPSIGALPDTSSMLVSAHSPPGAVPSPPPASPRGACELPFNGPEVPQTLDAASSPEAASTDDDFGNERVVPPSPERSPASAHPESPGHSDTSNADAGDALWSVPISQGGSPNSQVVHDATMDTDHDERIASLESDRSALEHQVKSSREECHALRIDNQALQEEVSSLRTANQDLQEEVSTLRSDYGTIIHAHRRLQTQYAVLHESSRRTLEERNDFAMRLEIPQMEVDEAPIDECEAVPAPSEVDCVNDSMTFKAPDPAPRSPLTQSALSSTTRMASSNKNTACNPTHSSVEHGKKPTSISRVLPDGSSAALPTAPTEPVPSPRSTRSQDLENQLAKSEARITTLMAEKAQRERELASLQAVHGALDDDHKAMLAEQQRLHSVLGGGDTPIQQQADERGQHQHDLASLKQTCSILTAENTDLNRRLSEVSTMLNASRAIARSAKESLDHHIEQGCVVGDGGDDWSSRFTSPFSTNPSRAAEDCALLAACNRGDRDEATAALASGASLDAQDDSGRSVLQLAVSGMHADLAIWLVAEHGCNPESATMSKAEIQAGDGLETPEGCACYRSATRKAEILTATQLVSGAFHRLCATSNLEAVREELNRDPSLVEQRNRYGATPLHAACVAGQVDVARELYLAGANVNAEKDAASTGTSLNQTILSFRDSIGCLYFAVMMKRMSIVQFLVREAGVSVNLRARNSGTTPLQVACFHGFSDLVRFFVSDVQADVNLTDNQGNSPLHTASSHGHLRIVQDLIGKANANAQIKQTNALGHNAVYSASWSGQLDVIRFLVARGADVNHQISTGFTPLHAACLNGHLDLVQFLILTPGAQLEQCDNYGFTPLSISSSGGYVDIVQCLTDNAAVDVNRINNAGFTPLHIASRNGRLDVVKYLTSKTGANVNRADSTGATPLHSATRCNRSDIVKFLAEETGACVAQADKSGCTPLHTAISNDNASLVLYLAGREKNLLGRVNKAGLTPLHLASMGGHFEGIRSLVAETSVDVNQPTTCGQTALYLACFHGHFRIVRYLVEEGRASVNLKNRDGLTPLHGCCLNGHEDVAKYLIRTGKANVNASTKDGLTPAGAAWNNHHRHIARFILFDCNSESSKCGIDVTGIKSLRVEHNLLSDGDFAIERPKLFFVGPPDAGKSSLGSALTKGTTLIQKLFSTASTTYEPTQGFTVTQRDIPGAGAFKMWDLGGHFNHRAANELCLRATCAVYVVMCSLRDPPEVQIRRVQYWLQSIVSNVNGVPKVILVGSHRDQAHLNSKTYYDNGMKRWESASAQRILNDACRPYRDRITVWPRFFCLDCRQVRDTEMDDLRSALKQLRGDVITRSDGVPKICEKLVACLPALRERKRMMSKAAIVHHLQEISKCPGLGDVEIDAVLRHLHDASHVLYFADHPQLCETVILDPHWFGSTFIGRIFSATSPKDGRTQSGVRTRKEVIAALAVNGDVNTEELDMAISLLLNLELCFPASGNTRTDEIVYVFPGFLTRDQTAQLKFVDNLATFLWVSRKFHRSENDVALPVRFFHQLQVRIAKKYGPSCNLWRDGIMVIQKTARAWLEISEDRCNLDVIVICPVGDSTRAIADLQTELVSLVTSLQSDVCGSVELVQFSHSGTTERESQEHFSIDALKAQSFDNRLVNETSLWRR